MPLLTPRSLIALAVGALFLALGMIDPALERLFAPYLVVILTLLTIDTIRVVSALNHLQLTRQITGQLGQFESNSITYRWDSRAAVDLHLTLKESGILPPLEIHPSPLIIEAQAGGGGEAAVHTTPLRRGQVVFPEFRVRAESPWRLITWQRRIRQKTETSVIPSLGVIRDFALWARREELALSGSARVQIREQGTYFKELRPYVVGDEIRQIDWKATARRNQLVVKEMEPERSQTLFLLIDLGRSMRTPVEQATRLDHALHTALVLAWIAASRGDLVGAAAFGEELRFFAPPRSGQAQVKVLLEGLSGLQAEPIEPDYRAAMTTVASLVRKRALMMLFTDVQSINLNRDLFTGLRALTGRHLPFIVTLPDPSQQALMETPPVDEAAMFHQGAVAEVLNERAEALRMIERSGGIVVDLPPQHLTAAVVSEYVRLKARNLL